MINGIDVSHWQLVADWGKVSDAGYRFAFLKATDGMAGTDPSFKVNLPACRRARVLAGAYHFFRPLEPFGAQAEAFLTQAQGVSLAALDLEWTKTAVHEVEDWDQVSADSRMNYVRGWLEQVEAAGVTPVVYTSTAFIQQYLSGADFLSRYPLWIPRYADSAGELPAPWAKWTFWQHSCMGRVEGIVGKVDLNIFDGSEEELRFIFRDPG